MRWVLLAVAALSACADFDTLDRCYGGSTACDSGGGADGGADGATDGAVEPGRAGPGIKPDETNTGVPPGVMLTVVNHDVTVTVDDTVIDAEDINGLLVIGANRVKVTRSIVRGRIVSGRGAAINVTSGIGVVLEDTEVAVVASPTLDGIWSRTLTARRMNIHVGGTGLRLSDSAVVEYSFVHGAPVSGARTSVVQIANATQIRLTGNQLTGIPGQNAALQVTQDTGLIAELVVESNWAGGGACTFNFADGGKGPYSLTVQKNRFMGNTAYENCAIVKTPQVTLVGTGNVWADTGAPAPIQSHN